LFRRTIKLHHYPLSSSLMRKAIDGVAVSYTHLDVYKRQGSGRPCLKDGRKVAQTAAGRPNIPPISTTDKIAAVL